MPSTPGAYGANVNAKRNNTDSAEKQGVFQQGILGQAGSLLEVVTVAPIVGNGRMTFPPGKRQAQFRAACAGRNQAARFRQTVTPFLISVSRRARTLSGTDQF